ncbi:hypothetical protein MKX03_032231 [Papaver bracteatum]|nr:hypothetical protein MKX03_032231 [Papaver bracteatum]
MDIHQLKKKIQNLEAADANLKEEMSKLIFSDNYEQSRSANSRRKGGVGDHVETMALPEIGPAASQHRDASSLDPQNPLRRSVNFTKNQCLNILQSVGWALHIFDLDGLVVYWNRAAEQLYGYSASEALGRNIIGFLVEEHDINAANELIRRIIVRENWTGLFPGRNKQELLQIFATTSPFYDDNGALVRVICLTSDSECFSRKHNSSYLVQQIL